MHPLPLGLAGGPVGPGVRPPHGGHPARLPGGGRESPPLERLRAAQPGPPALPREEVFAFFAEAGDLDLTPAASPLPDPLPQPLAMAAGARSGRRPAPAGCRCPGARSRRLEAHCSSTAARGLRIWIASTFEEQGGGTLWRTASATPSPAGRWPTFLFVAPDLRRIFAHRTRQLRERFGGGEGNGEEDGAVAVRELVKARATGSCKTARRCCIAARPMKPDDVADDIRDGEEALPAGEDPVRGGGRGRETGPALRAPRRARGAFSIPEGHVL